MPEVLVLVGIPGSGKSTWAAQYAERRGVVIVCPDTIRGELTGSEADQSVNEQAWAAAHQRMAELGQQGIPYVLDATNLERWRRIQMAADIHRTFPGATLVAVVFETPFVVCLDRNTRRDRYVPLHAMKRMHLQFNADLVARGEGFDRIDVVPYQD